MEIDLKERFSGIWSRYFPTAELPLIFYYTDEEGRAQSVPHPEGQRCLILDLKRVREGTPLAFDRESLGCAGAKRYLGFSDKLMPDFEYFLSCGIEGKVRGERYKKSPQLVAEQLKRQPPRKAPGRYIVFKRWDALVPSDNPVVVIFFATSDVLSGLFTLANFDESDPDGVIAPMGSGCASIVQYPLSELEDKRYKPVLGMFDVSARPHVSGDTLTFSVPWPKFVRMVDNVEESFLITDSWDKVRSRLER